MAFESQKQREKIGDISEAEKVFEARVERERSPEKNHFLAIYENLARTKADAYSKYLKDKEGFLEKEIARRGSADNLLNQLEHIDEDRERTERIGEVLRGSIKSRLEFLNKKVEKLAKLYNKMQADKSDISDIKEKKEKLEKKMEKLGDSPKDKRLKRKYEERLKEFDFDIEEKTEGLEFLKKHKIEEKFKKTWEDIWALQEREGTIPDYNILKEQLKMRLKEDEEEFARMNAVREQFEEMERLGVTPESILEAAERGEETLDRLYDEQEDIKEAVRGRKKFKLIGKIVSGSAQANINMMKSVLKKSDRYQTAENLSIGLFKVRAAGNGLIRKIVTQDKEVWYIPSVAEAQKATEMYKEPKENEEEIKNQFNHQILYESSILTNEPEIKEEQPVLEEEEISSVVESELAPPEEEVEPEQKEEKVPEEKPEVEIEKKDTEIDIAGKVSKKIFDGMVKQYEKYLESKSDDDKGLNALFKAMKKAGLKPGVIKKEGKYTKRWMKSIQSWAKNIEKMDTNKVKREMSNNFWSLIVKIHSVKDWKKTGVVRDLTGDVFKQFLLIRRLQALRE